MITNGGVNIPRVKTVCYECHSINTITPVVIRDSPVYTLPRQDPHRQQPKYRPAHACTECGLERDRPITTLASILRCYAESQGSLRVSPQEQAEMALRLHHVWNENYQSLPRARPPSEVLKIILQQIKAEDSKVGNGRGSQSESRPLPPTPSPL